MFSIWFLFSVFGVKHHKSQNLEVIKMSNVHNKDKSTKKIFDKTPLRKEDWKHP